MPSLVNSKRQEMSLLFTHTQLVKCLTCSGHNIFLLMKGRREEIMNTENQQTGFEEVAELETKQSKALPEALSDQQCYLTMSKTRFKC